MFHNREKFGTWNWDVDKTDLPYFPLEKLTLTLQCNKEPISARVIAAKRTNKLKTSGSRQYSSIEASFFFMIEMILNMFLIHLENSSITIYALFISHWPKVVSNVHLKVLVHSNLLLRNSFVSRVGLTKCRYVTMVKCCAILQRSIIVNGFITRGKTRFAYSYFGELLLRIPFWLLIFYAVRTEIKIKCSVFFLARDSSENFQSF